MGKIQNSLTGISNTVATVAGVGTKLGEISEAQQAQTLAANKTAEQAVKQTKQTKLQKEAIDKQTAAYNKAIESYKNVTNSPSYQIAKAYGEGKIDYSTVTKLNKLAIYRNAAKGAQEILDKGNVNIPTKVAKVGDLDERQMTYTPDSGELKAYEEYLNNMRKGRKRDK